MSTRYTQQQYDALAAEFGVETKKDLDNNLAQSGDYQVLDGNTIMVDGERLQINGANAAPGNYSYGEGEDERFVPGSYEGGQASSYLNDAISNAEDVYIEKDEDTGAANVYINGQNAANMLQDNNLNIDAPMDFRSIPPSIRQDKEQMKNIRSSYGYWMRRAGTNINDYGQTFGASSMDDYFLDSFTNTIDSMYNDTVYAATGIAGELGIIDQGSWLSRYNDKMQSQQKHQPINQFSSYKNVSWDNPESIYGYVAGGTGMIAGSIVGYGTVARIPYVGPAFAATMLSGEALHESLDGQDPLTANAKQIMTAGVVGIVNGRLEKFGFSNLTRMKPKTFTKDFLANANVIKAATGLTLAQSKSIMASMVAEGTTEFMQELAIMEGAKYASDKGYTPEEYGERLINSGIFGAFGGAGFSYSGKLMNDSKSFISAKNEVQLREASTAHGLFSDKSSQEIFDEEVSMVDNNLVDDGFVAEQGSNYGGFDRVKATYKTFKDQGVKEGFVKLAQTYSLAPPHWVVNQLIANGESKQNVERYAAVMQVALGNVNKPDVAFGSSLDEQSDAVKAQSLNSIRVIGDLLSPFYKVNTEKFKKRGLDKQNFWMDKLGAEVNTYLKWKRNPDSVKLTAEQEQIFNSKEGALAFSKTAKILNLLVREGAKDTASVQENFKEQDNYLKNAWIAKEGLTSKDLQGITSILTDSTKEGGLGLSAKVARRIAAKLISSQGNSSLEQILEEDSAFTQKDIDTIKNATPARGDEKGDRIKSAKASAVKQVVVGLGQNARFQEAYGETNPLLRAKKIREQGHNLKLSRKYIGVNGGKFDKIISNIAKDMGDNWTPQMAYYTWETMVRQRGLKDVPEWVSKITDFVLSFNILTMLTHSMWASAPELRLAGYQVSQHMDTKEYYKDYIKKQGESMAKTARSLSEDSAYQHFPSIGQEMTEAGNKYFAELGLTGSGAETRQHVDMAGPGMESAWMNTFSEIMLSGVGLTGITNATKRFELPLGLQAINADVQLLDAKVTKPGKMTKAQEYAAWNLREAGLDPKAFPALHRRFMKMVLQRLANDGGKTWYDLHTKFALGTITDAELKQYTGIIENASYNLRNDPLERETSKTIQEYDFLIKQAMNVMLKSRIMHAEASSRPLFYSNPYLRMFFQFQGFLGNFTAKVLPRLYRDYRKGNPEISYELFRTAATMIAIAAVAQGTKGALRDPGGDDEYLEDWQYAYRAITSSGLLGTYERYLDIVMPLHDYGEGIGGRALGGLLGPSESTVGRVGSLIGAVSAGDEALIDYNLSKLTPIKAGFTSYNDYR